MSGRRRTSLSTKVNLFAQAFKVRPVTDEYQSSSRGPWLVAPEPGVARRALLIAVAWAYVAALAAAIAIAFSALIALIVVLVVYLVDYGNREMEYAAVMGPAQVVAWMAIPLAAGLAIWTAGYGATQSDSIRRTVVGIAAAGMTGMAMWLIGSLALPMIVLAVGWAIAIPVEHPGRWIARIVVAVALLPLFPGWAGAGADVVAVSVAVSPVVAGTSVFLGDLGWSVSVRLRSRGDGGVVRGPDVV